MVHVQAFVTRIKVELSDLKPFWWANRGIKVTSELLKINNPECATAI